MFQNLDLSIFFQELFSSNLFTYLPEHPNDLPQLYNTTLRAVYDHHATIRQKTITTRRRVPWFNNTIKRAIQCRRKTERKWCCSAKPDDMTVFKEKINITTSLMNKERHSFNSNWIGQSHNDQRQLFRKAKTLLGLDSKHALPPHSCRAELCNEIANFFIQKVNTIKMNITSAASPTSSILTSDPEVLTHHQFSSISELSDEDIKRLVTSAPNKTCDLDPIPTKLVKSSLHILAPTRKKVINTFLPVISICVETCYHPAQTQEN